MEAQDHWEQMKLTGRIEEAPHTLLHEKVLEPQFNYELEHLLRWYIWAEKVLLLEYKHMGILADENVADIGAVLSQIISETLRADPKTNNSDIAFAIEQYVVRQLTLQGHQAPAWHVDRSRNDLQACAQLLFARGQLFKLVDSLFAFVQVLHSVAKRNTTTVMPGYTHFQAAQVISPGFYLAALSEQILGTLNRLLTVYDDINKCPLGAGAMSGQQLPWNRDRMANMLGFSTPQQHALTAVASRLWRLQIAGELSTLSITLSRFITDIISWGSSEHSFIDLPDELSAISSAMPQKKNFPILERIRGKTSHIAAFYIDFLLGEHNTPYTNLVEVSKEGGSYLLPMFTTMQSVLQLFTVVIEHVQFQYDHMRTVCMHEYLGSFTLANYLTLHNNIPYRTAQVIVGRYIVSAIERQLEPTQPDELLLQSLGRDYGYDVSLSHQVLEEILSVDHNLNNKQSSGSTAPKAVYELLELQEEEAKSLRYRWHSRREHVEQAFRELDSFLFSLYEKRGDAGE